MLPRRWGPVVLVAVSLLLAAAGSARAGGFLIYDLSGEANAKGSAVAAGTREPAAVWYNPAALTEVPGVQLSLGVEMFFTSPEFEADADGRTYQTKDTPYFIPNLFATGRVTDWLAVGFGAYMVFGLGNEWDADWIGREASIKSNLTTMNLNPSLAFRILPTLSLGVGFDAVRGVVDLTNGLPDPIGGTVRIAGEGWGFGGNIGLLWKALPEVFHVAATYRSRVKIAFDGRADFDTHPEFARELADQKGSSEVLLPDIVTLGLHYRPTPELELGLDANMVLWSTYDELVFDFAEAPRQVIEARYEDSFVVRAGVDWATPIERLHVRGGLIWDQGPTRAAYREPSVPDEDQIDVCLGLGYGWRFLTLDAGYQLVLYFPAEATTGRFGPEGTYRTLAHFLTLTLTARLWEPETGRSAAL